MARNVSDDTFGANVTLRRPGASIASEAHHGGWLPGRGQRAPERGRGVDQAVVTVRFLAGPVVALLVIGVLLVAARWARMPARSLPNGVLLEQDFGLLVPVAVVDSPAEVAAARCVLRSEGIRSTWALVRSPLHLDAAGNILSRLQHRHHVLVFGSDAARANRLLAALRRPPGR